MSFPFLNPSLINVEQISISGTLVSFTDGGRVDLSTKDPGRGDRKSVV